MIKKTILLTSVGRRDYIINYFKELPGYDCKVIACNSVENTTGMWAADKAFVAPPIKSNEYIPFLLNICKMEKVDILISLFDLDVLYLSANKNKFEEIDVLPVLPDSDIVSICLDKIKTNRFLNKLGIRTPGIYENLESVIKKLENNEISFPLILKPQWGQGSIATELVNNKEELFHAYHFLSSKVKKTSIVDVSGLNINNIMLIQEFVEGEEYGIDCINDLEGTNVAVIVKKKFAMRAGETDAAVTTFDEKINAVGKLISTNLQHTGLLDVDLIKQKDNVYVIDLNPRFGGGYPFSHAAGINMPKAILDWSCGKKLDDNYFKYEENLLTLKSIKMVSKHL